MGNVKVTPGLMIGLLNYVAGRFGSNDHAQKEMRAKAKQEFIGTLDDELKNIFIGPDGKPALVPRHGNVDYRLFSRMLDSVVEYSLRRVPLMDEEKVCRDIGIKSAERDFGKQLRLYNEEAYKKDPKLVFNATPVIWPNMYTGTEMKVTNFKQDVHVDFEISRFPEITKRNCMIISSWIQQACYMISGLEGSMNIEYKPKPGIDCRIRFDVTKVKR